MAASPTRPVAESASSSPVGSAPVIGSTGARRVLAALRIVIGWVFFWAFIDKAFGLSFNTAPEDAWIAGGSPTSGYLMGASDGALGGMFEAMSGVAVVDWLFMLGLLGLGVAALAGVGLRVAAVAGALMAGMMYVSQLPLEAGADTNPITTSHWYYALLFVLFPLADAGRTWGLGGWWANTSIVRAVPWLR